MEEAIRQAARALFKTMINPATVIPRVERAVETVAPDPERLVVDFLEEVLYFFDADNLVFHDVEFTNSIKREPEYRLCARFLGEKFDATRHEPDTEVKAITYSYIKVHEGADGAEIEVVFDI